MRQTLALMALLTMSLGTACLAQDRPTRAEGFTDMSLPGGAMKLTSVSFKHNGTIPSKFTCEGADINPGLQIEGIPSTAKSLALIVDDPDAPMGTWVHWVVFDIAPTPSINEDSVPGKQGQNSFGRLAYGGPCPPSGTHRYFFKLYALDTMLGLDAGISKQELENAMLGHVLAQAELIGLYQKVRNAGF